MLPGTVSIVECRKCAFAWQAPVKENEEGWEEKLLEAGDPFFEDQYRYETADLQFEFVSRFKQGRALLDVGAGRGHFVKTASKCFDAVGVEPTNAIFDRKLPEANLIHGYLTDIDRKFDAITLWDVIEHVPDPLAVISQLPERLNPDGYVFIETGNFRSTDRAENEDHWWGYQNDHRWFFSPRHLTEVLKVAGFKNFHLCDRVLRKKAKMRTFTGPSPIHHIKMGVKRPWKLPTIIQRYNQLSDIYRTDADVATLGIFAIAATR